VYWPRRTNIIEKHFAAAVAHEEVYRRLAEAAIRREGLSRVLKNSGEFPTWRKEEVK
jgi:hypothetical protein